MAHLRNRRWRWAFAAALSFAMTCSGAGTTVSVNAMERPPDAIEVEKAPMALVVYGNDARR